MAGLDVGPEAVEPLAQRDEQVFAGAATHDGLGRDARDTNDAGILKDDDGATDAIRLSAALSLKRCRLGDPNKADLGRQPITRMHGRSQLATCRCNRRCHRLAVFHARFRQYRLSLFRETRGRTAQRQRN